MEVMGTTASSLTGATLAVVTADPVAGLLLLNVVLT